MCPASFAALPLWEAAVDGAPEDRGTAVFPAGEIVSVGRRYREYDSALEPHAARTAETAVVADAHLPGQAHDTHYVHRLRGMLALEGRLAWAWGLDATSPTRSSPSAAPAAAPTSPSQWASTAIP
ncbi:hypothetical protein B4N89_47275 [Embleya scabrispora]|uniref:Uncharacterized protein n=1 Tax=Embleya scabrispora TaxID=159449 RepID=A0A1T3NHV1_9ACTN|nr:hypothetical protein B4N89_47275 [Embleya scabrispora]